MSGISVNEDSTDFFYTRKPEQMTEEGVDAFVDTFAGTQVKELMFNVNGRYASYPSKVWETLWKGYSPDGNHGPELASRFEGCIPENRLDLLHNLYLLEERGIDPYERWMIKCRAVGISPWISSRMNDLHHLQMPLTERRRVLESAEKQLHRVTYRRAMTCEDGAPDYAQEEIYQHNMALIRECAEKYDMDGFELDFTRHYHFFKPFSAIQDQKIMTLFVREARKLLKAQEQHHGHQVKLCVKVPSDERTSRLLGMDAIHWAKEGLVDYIIPGPRWESADFDIRIDEWKRLLEGTDVLLGAAIEPRVQPYFRYKIPKEFRGQGLVISPELVRGAASNYLNQGADRVYLMNFFDWRKDLNGTVLIKEGGLLDQVGSLETISGKSRRHMITSQDTIAPGQSRGETLPIAPYIDYEGDPYFGQLRISTGQKPASGTATIILEFGKESDGLPDDFEIYVNGCKPEPTDVELSLPVPADNYYGFEFPAEALNDGDNIVELMSTKPWSVHWAEIQIKE
jgi:hypothetical protein